MESDKFDDIFVQNLLPFYLELISQEEYELLRENFYYNFENISARFPTRTEAIFSFAEVCTSKLGKEKAQILFEILGIGRVFEIEKSISRKQCKNSIGFKSVLEN